MVQRVLIDKAVEVLFQGTGHFRGAPRALARGWSVRYWFCLATWVWSVASFACRVSLISWARRGLRRST